MEPGKNSRTERRRGIERRRRDMPGFADRERRIIANRRHASVAERGDDAGSETPTPVVHKLLPADGRRYLSPLRVVARMESEFSYLEVDDAEGSRRVGKIIDQVRKAHRNLLHRTGDSRLAHLEKVKDSAIHLQLGDDPGSETEYLSVTVIPEEPLIVECESVAHAKSAEPLLRRCAKALGYSIIRAPFDK